VALIDDLIEKIKQLPPDKRVEVLLVVESLLEETPEGKAKKIQFSWAGKLHDHKKFFTSLELEQKASEWRI